ncbi:MAG: hypothetical protein JSV92_04645 [archaeon]|nr:MAG: hypothetical protein JSV92_04645 [archaeon]
MSKIPEIKRRIYNFLIEEKGSISKQKALSLGSFLGTASILSLLPEVAATHTNVFKVSWVSATGTIQGTHAHHASHASHGSHSSHSSVELVETIPLCFLEGTKITMKEGDEKEIEKIRKGDVVLSYNLEKDVIENSEVLKTFKHSEDESMDYFIIINDKIKVTPNHPIFLKGEWKEAGTLEEGDKIFRRDGRLVAVNNIKRVKRKVKTYNLEVAKNHNYFAERFLVHNK